MIAVHQDRAASWRITYQPEQGAATLLGYVADLQTPDPVIAFTSPVVRVSHLSAIVACVNGLLGPLKATMSWEKWLERYIPAFMEASGLTYAQAANGIPVAAMQAWREGMAPEEWARREADYTTREEP
jgi:hypothetical protein